MLVNFNNNPVVNNKVLFTLLTPDVNNCFLSDPYEVVSVVVYFIERDFASPNENIYNNVTPDTVSQNNASIAIANACANPTPANILLAQQAQNTANSLATTTPFYYNEAVSVKTVGSDAYPAWLSTNQSNALIKHITTDANGNTVYGQFEFIWDSYGQREGDYFICWTWMPNIAGDALSQNLKFNLGGNTAINTSIPTHYTDPAKYYNLLTLYLPEMFKMQITTTDLSPMVLDQFNQAVGQGFTMMENLANQIFDLQDANSLQQQFLPLLANYFGITLKSNDPALWRRQIKQAIPLFKKKGTRSGLYEALAQAGFHMQKLARLWQIISNYTWQDAFTYDGTNDCWQLTKLALPLDQNNFGLWIRIAGSASFIQLSSDYVYFSTSNGVTTMCWQGNTLSVNPIDLVEGDIILVLYLYNYIPNETYQMLENYIRSLPLADQRDETLQEYPLKNWNVRVIEEDDPLFDIIIPDRQPYTEPLVFGQVRTEFAYSENVYNADEYNGSIRNSKLPCDIDKNFLDPCSACLGSKFNIYLSIDDLSNDRILEAQEVILEFKPFHSQLQTLNFTGNVVDYMLPPQETIEIFVNFGVEDFMICGEGQTWFNRSMRGVTITRSQLANVTQPITLQAGILYNSYISIFCPEVFFDEIGMSTDGSAILEILAPSPNAGIYNLSNPHKHTAEMSSAIEPINTAQFTFRVSNILVENTLCNINQNNIITVIDPNNQFLSVITINDVSNGFATTPYTISIPSYNVTAYGILQSLPNGSLQLVDINETLPLTNVSNIPYTLLDQNNNVVLSGNLNITVVARALVESLDSSIQNIQNFIRGTCYLLFEGNQYLITGVLNSNSYYISGYTLGDMAGISVDIYQRIADNEVGYLGYQGMNLQTPGNLEVILNVQNGANPPTIPLEDNDFLGNFLLSINNQDYFINSMNGNSPAGYTTMGISGANAYYGTLGSGGTNVNFNVLHFIKNSFFIPGQQFDLEGYTFTDYDRRSREIISYDINSGSEIDIPLLKKDNGFYDAVRQEEHISYEIVYEDGSSEKGEI